MRGRTGLTIAGALLVLACVAVVVALARGGGERSVAGKGPDRRAEIEVDPDRGHENGGRSPTSDQYENRAYPRSYISSTRVKAALKDFRGLPTRLGSSSFKPGTRDIPARASVKADWRFLGPDVPFTPGPTTESLRDSLTSGRITSLAVDPRCDEQGTGTGTCTVYVAAASGGVWRTDNALAAAPAWKVVDDGLPTNAIGVLLLDPSDPDIIYAGTGESNQINQSGLGLYRSVNRGESWSLVPGSDAVAHDRSIGALRIDGDGNLWIGTSLGRLGQSSANGGQSEPPGAPTLGVYERPRGSSAFALKFALPGDLPTDPTLPNRRLAGGGVNDLEVDSANPGTVYAAIYGYGVWRSSDGGDKWGQVFNPVDEEGNPAGLPAADQRSEIAITHAGGATRLYLADGGSNPDGDPTGSFWRADDAQALPDDNVANLGWTRSTTPETNQLCQGQCTYDLFVEVDPSNADVVWFGGSMVYEEIRPLQDQSLIGLASNRSNGRAVMRSEDGGQTFTDMTADTRDRDEGHYEQMHPDQHALVFDPHDTNIAFVGSDGGLVRTDGTFDDQTDECDTRDGVKANPTDYALCKRWLSKVPHRIENLNAGLGTLQFDALSVDPRNPHGELLGGTQDNGTFAFAPFRDSPGPSWFESVNGDGGPSAFDVGDANVRFHTYFLGLGDINHHGTDPNFWSFATQPLVDSGEFPGNVSFYTPVEGDPKVPGSIFIGAAHVWRTKDDGGDAAALEAHCRAPGGVPQFDGTITCGDFAPLGGDAGNLVAGPTADRGGSYTVDVERAPNDTGTLWVSTRRGRIFVSENADAANPDDVTFNRIDTPSTPGRFPSGISIDPADPNHAFVSYSGFDAYTPLTPGHVFDVRYDRATKHATFTDLSDDLPDTPVNDVALDGVTGDLYASTDYGVLRRPAGAVGWTRLAGLPNVIVAGLTLVPQGRVLYAATYGRSIWSLALPAAPSGGGGGGAGGGGPSGGGGGGPEKIGSPAIVSRRIRVSRTRTAVVRLRCGRTTAGGRCKGVLSGESGPFVVGHRSFSVRADRLTHVRLKLTRTVFRRLVKRRQLRATLTLVTRGADFELRRTTARVTLLAPRRRH